MPIKLIEPVYWLVKVKKGARMSVDRHFERCENGGDIWLATRLNGGDYDCRKPGHGTRENYVNGSAYVRPCDVELLTPMCLLASPLLDNYRRYAF